MQPALWLSILPRTGALDLASTGAVETDREVGRLKLESLGVGIDSLSAEQQKYQDSWEEGT